MQGDGGRQVDPHELIKRLSTKIADLTVQNTMLQMALEDIEIENAKLKQAHIDQPSA